MVETTLRGVNQKVKKVKGILPTSATFSTDLHSLGQFIQKVQKFFMKQSCKLKNQLEYLF